MRKLLLGIIGLLSLNAQLDTLLGKGVSADDSGVFIGKIVSMIRMATSFLLTVAFGKSLLL